MERATPSPILGLATGGVYPNRCCHRSGWSLTPPFHPCSRQLLGAVLFLWHFPPRCYRGPCVTRRRALRSPDFPPRFYRGDRVAREKFKLSI